MCVCACVCVCAHESGHCAQEEPAFTREPGTSLKSKQCRLGDMCGCDIEGTSFVNARGILTPGITVHVTRCRKEWHLSTTAHPTQQERQRAHPHTHTSTHPPTHTHTHAHTHTHTYRPSWPSLSLPRARRGSGPPKASPRPCGPQTPPQRAMTRSRTLEQCKVGVGVGRGEIELSPNN